MATTLNPATQAKVFEDRRSTELLQPVGDMNRGRFSRRRPSFAKRAMRVLVRLLITFGIGVAATLAWQSYGDAARQMVANASPQLGWLAPRAAPVAQIAPTPVAAAPDLRQLTAISMRLEALQKSVDRLAAQVAASQPQMAGDIAKLQETGQEILQKISAPSPRPPAPPARKPASRLMPAAAEEPQVR